MMKKTKIEWCDSTWNPVTGCYHECEYCYARKIANRYGAFETVDGNNIRILDTGSTLNCAEVKNLAKTPYPLKFTPTLHRYRLDEPQRWQKPRTIFVCSMADLFGSWVSDEWIEEVFEACRKAPQHRYLFLTKNPQRYLDLAKNGKFPTENNMWFGYSATRQDEFWRFKHADDCPIQNLFVSIEPILGYANAGFSSHCPADWVIIGAETGNRKDKVKPKREWIEQIAMECYYSGRPIFMKDSLIPIIGEENMRREFPWNGGSLK